MSGMHSVVDPVDGSPEAAEQARAYLLDLLQGGGVQLHIDYVNLVTLGISPHSAVHHNGGTHLARQKGARGPQCDRRAGLLVTG